MTYSAQEVARLEIEGDNGSNPYVLRQRIRDCLVQLRALSEIVERQREALRQIIKAPGGGPAKRIATQALTEPEGQV